MVEPQHSINIEIVRPDLWVIDVKGFLRFIPHITALDDYISNVAVFDQVMIE